MIQSVATLYGMATILNTGNATETTGQSSPISSDSRPSFLEDRSLSPKEFVWQKQPRRSIERVVCLAYYLVHYRGTQFFKTSDITALNMEAAQLKFSNPAMMVA